MKRKHFLIITISNVKANNKSDQLFAPIVIGKQDMNIYLFAGYLS